MTIINNFNRGTRSYLCNINYWARNILKLRSAIKERNRVAAIIKTPEDIKKYMSSFVWEPERVDWDPWVITVISNDLKDDCDGSSAIGKYLFDNIGIKASVYHLYGSAGGHAIAVTDDHKYIVSNSNVCDLNPLEWKQDIYNYFDNKYFYIEKYLGG